MEVKKLKLSRFVYTLEKNNIIALFHSLRIRVIYVKKNVYEKVMNFLNNQEQCNDKKTTSEDVDLAIDELKRIKFLLPTEVDELKDLDKIKESLLGKVNFRMMYLLLTDRCNLRCSYCFLERQTPLRYQRLNMNKATILQAIEFYTRIRQFKNFKKDREQEEIIHLYGGEPLLNFTGLRVAVEYIHDLKMQKRLPPNLKVVMVTNGTLIDDEIAQYFRDKDISVGISLDGPLVIHNKYRKYSSSKGSFMDTLRGYNLLIKHKVKTGISCTITPDLINNLDLFFDFVKHLDNCDGISFNILHCNLGIETKADYYTDAAIFITKAFEELRKMGIYEERMLRKITAFLNHQIVPFDCGAEGEQIAVGPAGLVSVCQDTLRCSEFIIAKVSDLNFNPLENDIIKQWSLRSPLNIPECISCPALGICGGGCPINAFILNGSMWSVDKRICPHSLYTLEWMIWDLYSHMRQKIV